MSGHLNTFCQISACVRKAWAMLSWLNPRLETKRCTQVLGAFRQFGRSEHCYQKWSFNLDSDHIVSGCTLMVTPIFIFFLEFFMQSIFVVHCFVHTEYLMTILMHRSEKSSLRIQKFAFQIHFCNVSNENKASHDMKKGNRRCFVKYTVSLKIYFMEELRGSFKDSMILLKIICNSNIEW